MPFVIVRFPYEQWSLLSVGSTSPTPVFISRLIQDCGTLEASSKFIYQLLITTSIAATAIAETTGIADQNPLTTQFYLLLAE